MDSEILSFTDLKKILNVTNNKINRLCKRGMPYVNLRNEDKVFLRGSVLEWLKSLEQPKSPEPEPQKDEKPKLVGMGQNGSNT